MKPYRSTLAVLLVAAATAVPCAAQHAPSPAQALPTDACAGCFAYLVFSPPLEPETYAVRGEAAGSAFPAADGPAPRPREHAANLLAPSKQ